MSLYNINENKAFIIYMKICIFMNIKPNDLWKEAFFSQIIPWRRMYSHLKQNSSCHISTKFRKFVPNGSVEKKHDTG